MTDHRQQPVRFSNLKALARSPAHYLEAVTSERESTAAMRIGTLAHHRLLGGECRTVLYGGTRRGKEWEAFKSKVPAGVEIVSSTEVTASSEIAAAVRRHDRAAGLLIGTNEQTIHWEWCGRACRSTPDSYTTRRVVELKTTMDASPDGFMRYANRNAYVNQLAFYRTCLRTMGLSAADDAYIVAVESKPPYCVSVFHLDGYVLDLAERQNRLWMERLLACEAADEWPGYVQSDVEWALPEYEDDDFSLTIGGESVEVE